ncbi:hypothetical protein D9C73_000900 [Collichthys lucidus]|uniref:Uncharacterized protein n=1 Tax=Collichthys lucidus TaxID=240159 RepID=A0A4U5U157_COLLU|nr:hypothetical protein D9C73_000900 [Collichthys lucidus]
MGHSTAEDLLENFKECTKDLNLRNMLSLSMDGPSVNWKWLENLPAVERALEVWPSIVKYVDLVRTKKVKNPGTSSFDSVCEAQMDSLLLAKFHFFMAISRVFQPFLTKYQTDVPMMPFLWEDLETLMRNLFKRFIKREALPQTPYKLVRLDVVDHAMWLSPKEVDIGLGATAVIKRMHLNPDDCLKKMKALVQKFLQDKQLAGGISTGDVISQQFENVLHSEAKELEFLSFSPSEGCRVDVFLHQKLSQSYPDLWAFCKKLLLLSHGQAEVERGFSTNKEVEICNLSEEGMTAHRLICDHVRVYGGDVTRVPLTKEMITYCATARTRYRTYLEEERNKKGEDDQRKKRKMMVDELEELKRKRVALEGVCEGLQNEADQMADKAENSGGTKMATLITKSNTLRRRAKEKREELVGLKADIEEKSDALRQLDQ